ncbi:UvrB/UvrC motif-containing protein [Pseudobacteroides cellulosolvens]|uniref:UvrB/UvrC protein n=1 Tax=Pseudobacteroides cellulosolvens ATCC 35603 = DSM 2933 TaxID=398512 RepID=A0A0L6JNW8_9FIRM|nr:UvrB/UvrC motif-containing protein [Pseudobacteroides cellulosolvens]KNY27473.1 UvrB/UvrC protein [Pseudobacteroides cellulosolvens ATCC 35603 = DSM 2933]
MMCENCQERIASVHFTQVVNNKKVEMHLCKQCAKEKGHLSFGSTIDVNDFLKGIFGIGSSSSYYSPGHVRMVCEKCGMSYEEFQKVGKFGCSKCYEMYGDGIKPLLKRLHGSVEHHGKAPKLMSESHSISNEIDKLKAQLQQAIEKEEYEKAAEIRDKIKSLE